MVIFHRVTRDFHHNLFKSVHGSQHCELHVDWQRSADSVGIDEMGVEPFRLEENLMAIAVCKTMDLVFDRGAIAWARCVNRATKQR